MNGIEKTDVVKCGQEESHRSQPWWRRISVMTWVTAEEGILCTAQSPVDLGGNGRVVLISGACMADTQGQDGFVLLRAQLGQCWFIFSVGKECHQLKNPLLSTY